MTPSDDENVVPQEDLESLPAPRGSSPALPIVAGKKTDFAPWHHPVKQVVRSLQWAALTERLIKDYPAEKTTLNYFTLPGADMLDVRVLGDVCVPKGLKIRYFGFDSGWSDNSGNVTSMSSHASRAVAEAALRQAGITAANARVAPDRLEDIAVPGSQAELLLRSAPLFDVINIDACDHLAYKPQNREVTTFDALRVLLAKQMKATNPWLLFITTRAEPGLLGEHGADLLQAVYANIASAPLFRDVLAQSIGCKPTTITAAVNAAWIAVGDPFLKMFSLGVAKYLLQYFAIQPNCPANVELSSAFTYCVHGDNPNMAALAFLVTPDPVQAILPHGAGPRIAAVLEPERACVAARRMRKLMNIDERMESNHGLREKAVLGTMSLLTAANYDIPAWRTWVSEHRTRPMPLDAVPAANPVTREVSAPAPLEPI